MIRLKSRFENLYLFRLFRFTANPCVYFRSCSWTTRRSTTTFRPSCSTFFVKYVPFSKMQPLLGSTVFLLLHNPSHYFLFWFLSALNEKFTQQRIHTVVNTCYSQIDRSGSHLVGHFSKEQLSENNLACIMILPPFQRKGYGKLLIQLSRLIRTIKSL